MKKMTCMGTCLVATAVLAASIAQAQQGAAAQAQQGAGGAGAAAQTGQGAVQQGNLQGQQPSGIDTQSGAALQQGGQQPQPAAGGIETRQNVIGGQNRFGQQRGFNLQGGIPDRPTQAELQAQQPPEAGMRQGQLGEQSLLAQGQPGELGVWLVASGGPGVEIRRVTEGSAAAQVGLQPGDVILQVNGQAASSPQAVAQLIRRIPSGQVATIEIWRDGSQQELQVALQPARESYDVGYRGDTASRNGDLASRTMRLEEQLSMVMQELQRVRQELEQLRTGGGQATGGGGELDQNAAQPFQEPSLTPTEPEPAQPEATTAPSTTEAPAATETEADPFGETTTETEADPFGGATTEPAATEPATAEPATTEPATEEATPAATETESETETDLFQ